MSRAHRLATLLLAVVTLLVACNQSQSSDSPSPSAVVGEPSPSAEASTSVVASLPSDGDVFPGTYETAFEPPLMITIGDIVYTDCAPGYRCRGDVNANQTAFLDIDFGKPNAPEFMVMRLDKVFDSAGQVIDPPSDVVALIESAPGVEVSNPAMAVRVGGLDATQIDVWAHQGLDLGPGVGFASEHETRIIVVTVEGYVVVITEQIGAQNTTGNFQAALEALQPLVDSIEWQ